MTFEDLESCFDMAWKPEGEMSALDEWYSSVRNKQLEDFDDFDLGIALRQELFLQYIIPISIKKLLSDYLAGFKYDGEILVALANIELEKIPKSELNQKLKSLLAQELVIKELSNEGLESDLNKLMTKLS